MEQQQKSVKEDDFPDALELYNAYLSLVHADFCLKIFCFFQGHIMFDTTLESCHHLQVFSNLSTPMHHPLSGTHGLVRDYIRFGTVRQILNRHTNII